MRVDKQTILILIVPTVFLAAILSFFFFIQGESRTLTTFVAYMSGLSTTIMVLVYIVTYSRQLENTSKQLKEMQYSRDVQVQPLPYLETGVASIQLPNFYSSPDTNFKEMGLYSGIKLDFTIINHGNGPALVIDFITKLFSIPLTKESEILSVSNICDSIDCIPTGKTQKIDFALSDHSDCGKIFESLIEDTRVTAYIEIAYKNALGKPFLEKVQFYLSVGSREDMLSLKNALKLTRTCSIDFGSEIRQFKTLSLENREEERSALLEKCQGEVNKLLKGKEIQLDVCITHSSFKIRAISEKEYEEWIEKKKSWEKEARNSVHSCWKMGNNPRQAELQ